MRADAPIDRYAQLADVDWTTFADAKLPQYDAAAGGGAGRHVGRTVAQLLGQSSTDALPEGANPARAYYTVARFDARLAVKSTDDLAEGANPARAYYTQARFDVALAAKSTTDLAEGANLYFTNARADARADARIATQAGAPSGLASLGADSKIATAQLPALAITDTFAVASQAAMLALTAERGDVAVRTDLNKSYILAVEDPSVLAHWQELLTPTDAVLSVNGFTGSVVLTTSNVAEGSNLYYADARARAAISVSGTPLTYNSGTGVLGFSSPLAATLGGTGLTSYATGDTLYASAADTLAKLAAGTQNYTLQMGASVPAWASVWMRDTSGATQYLRPQTDVTVVRIGVAIAPETNALLGVRRDTAGGLALISDDTVTLALTNRTGTAGGAVYNTLGFYSLNAAAALVTDARIGVRHEADTTAALEFSVLGPGGTQYKVAQFKRRGLALGTGADQAAGVGIPYQLFVRPSSNAIAGSTAYFQDLTAATGVTGVDIEAGQGQSTGYLLRCLAYESTGLGAGAFIQGFRPDGYVPFAATADPSAPASGQLFYQSNHKRPRFYDGAAFATLLRRGGPITLTDAATIATDASLGDHFRVTLGGNRTLGAPTNPVDGQWVTWEVTQDATGGRTLTPDAGTGGFTFGTQVTAFSVDATANKTSYVRACYNLSANKWRVTTGQLGGYT